MTNSVQSKDLKIRSKNSFFVSQKIEIDDKLSRQKQNKKQFHFQNKKKTDLEDFEKLFIQSHSLANVVKLELSGKLQKIKKYKKKNQTTEERKKKHKIF